MWEKFRKVYGNYKPRIVSPLDRGGNIITSPDENADTFIDHYANISKYFHEKTKLGKKRALNTIKVVAGKKFGRRSKNPKKLSNIRYSFCRKIKETRQHTQRRHKNIYRDLQNFTSRIPTCRSK